MKVGRILAVSGAPIWGGVGEGECECECEFESQKN